MKEFETSLLNNASTLWTLKAGFPIVLSKQLTANYFSKLSSFKTTDSKSGFPGASTNELRRQNDVT
jgi:hypothetical protein